jgi:hypothetical protein
MRRYNCSNTIKSLTSEPHDGLRGIRLRIVMLNCEMPVTAIIEAAA